jgi:predicted ArsR family transcriptional regulator
VASTPDQAVDQAVESLRAVGFSAEASPLKDSITIGACPFAALVDEHPIICAIHTELLSTVLSASGQEVEVEAMDVWVTPTLCRARLARPDQTPARTIDPKAYGTQLTTAVPTESMNPTAAPSHRAASPTE